MSKSREELLHDASTIISTLNTADSRLSEHDVNYLTNCYKEKACSAEIMNVLKKYDVNQDSHLDITELAPILEGVNVVADVQRVMAAYDTNQDGKLSPEEMKVLIKDYEEKKGSREVLDSLSRWDLNQDGKLDERELQVLVNDIKSTDSNLRYTGYTFIVPTIFRHAIRYSAYVSDFGESFRPIIALRLVRFTYMISWSYVIGDVLWEGFKAHHYRKESPKEVAEVVVERAIFQSVASMLLPMFLIHNQVKVASMVVDRIPNVTPKVRKWGPTVAGLALIPFLPFFLDKPVEYCLEEGKAMGKSLLLKRSEKALE